MPVVLGHGSWGPVHKAFNTDLRCYAAVRTIAHAAFETDEARERFVREASLAARVRHPGLAAVFPIESGADRFLYANEYVAGETLSQRLIRDGRLELVPALQIISQLASSLEMVSSVGLLHRNITASNVMLVEEDQDVAVKLLDFALPARPSQENGSLLGEKEKFSSPEECGDRQIDVRSEVYSLAAILYYALVGTEAYRVFRAKSSDKQQASFEDAHPVPAIALILKRSLCYDPEERIAGFAELRDAVDAILRLPKRTGSNVAAQPAPADEAEEAKDFSLIDSSGRAATRMWTSASLTGTDSKSEGLIIPSTLLGAAQPGATLILSRNDQTSEQIVICSRNRFRIGRSSSAGSDLTIRFLPRNSVNDAKTRRLSRIHVTAKCTGPELLLFDGDGANPSANGSTFAGQVLSTESPVALESGELRLAEVYSIKVELRTFEHRHAPVIANVDDWKGPAPGAAPRLAGAVVFVPAELNSAIAAVWLFSVAAFGSSGTSPLEFALPTGSREIGALHYYRGCFWIEARSAHAISLEGLALAPAQIAPLIAAHVVQISGAKYSIKIDDRK